MGANGTRSIGNPGILMRFGGLTAILLIWFTGIGAHVGGRVDALRDSFAEVAEISQPRSAAAYEMEINILGTGMAVAKYLHRPDPAHLARIQEDSGEFMAFLQQYRRLAKTERERGLIENVERRYSEFHALGLELIAAKDRQQAAVGALSLEIDEMEEIVEVALPAAAGAATPDSDALAEIAGRIRVELEHILHTLVHTGWDLGSGFGESFEAASAEIRKLLAALSSAQPGVGQAQHIAQLTRRFETFEPATVRFFASEVAINRDFDRLLTLRTELDHLLDDEIQLFASDDLARANVDVAQGVRATYAALWIAAASMLAALAIAILFVSRSFVAPVRRLAEAAGAFGRGALNSRVSVSNRGELGALATAFNRMAADIEGAQAKLERVNAKLETMVAERTQELRRANRALEDELKARRAMEAELRAAQRDAEAANHAKTAFLANMSHELRTPLNAILGFAETMQMKVFGPLGHARYDEYIGDIRASGHHLLKLINDVLDVSAIELGRVAINAERVGLGEAVRESLELTAWRAQRKRIALDARVPDDLPPAWADKLRLKQIFANLIDNALKFSPEDSTLSIAAAPLGGDRLAVTFADQGPGMTGGDGGSPLESLSGADPSLADRNKGAGLGLAISQRLVEMQGGSLTIGGAPGTGTVVTVVLPCGPPAVGPDHI